MPALANASVSLPATHGPAVTDANSYSTRITPEMRQLDTSSACR